MRWLNNGQAMVPFIDALTIICVNGRIIADGTPAQVITPAVLERTFGARMEVLEHLGMRVVVDETPSLQVVRGGQ